MNLIRERGTQDNGKDPDNFVRLGHFTGASDMPDNRRKSFFTKCQQHGNFGYSTQACGKGSTTYSRHSSMLSIVIGVKRLSVAMIIKEYLKIIGKEGWAIVELYHLNDALGYACRHCVDILILDEDLISEETVPGWLSTCTGEAMRPFDVIILSSLKEFRGSAAMKNLGADCMLYKPFDLESLGRLCFKRLMEKSHRDPVSYYTA